MTKITTEQQNSISATYDRRIRREMLPTLTRAARALAEALEELANEKNDEAFDDAFAEMHASLEIMTESVGKHLAPTAEETRPNLASSLR